MLSLQNFDRHSRKKHNWRSGAKSEKQLLVLPTCTSIPNHSVIYFLHQIAVLVIGCHNKNDKPPRIFFTVSNILKRQESKACQYFFLGHPVTMCAVRGASTNAIERLLSSHLSSFSARCVDILVKGERKWEDEISPPRRGRKRSESPRTHTLLWRFMRWEIDGGQKEEEEEEEEEEGRTSLVAPKTLGHCLLFLSLQELESF